jgi:hypothetical protein
MASKRGRILAPLVATAVLAVFSAGAQAATGDSLSGHGRLTVGDASASVTVSAKSDADGSNASGTIRIDRTGEHTFSGVADVVCLRVEGNEASAVGRLRRPVEKPDEPGTYYQYVIVWALDSGSPTAGPDEWNTAATWGPPGRSAPSCSFFVGGGANEIGNLRVVDS